MKRLLFEITISLFIIPVTGRSQAKNNIEFSVFNIYSIQAKYSSRFGNVSYTNNLQLYGTNFGFTVDYKKLLTANTYLKLGLGYMNFDVDKIINKSSAGYASSASHSRPINLPLAIFILYSTTKYHYNTMLYHMGIERQFRIAQTTDLFAGLEYYFAYNLNQDYYIPGRETDYRISNHGGLGNFFNLNLGINQQLGKVCILPALVIPIYKSWKQDIIFLENPNNTVSNWSNGIGFSLGVSISL